MRIREDMPFLIVRGRDHLVDSRDEDITLRINELAHEGDEIGHRLVHHATKHA